VDYTNDTSSQVGDVVSLWAVPTITPSQNDTVVVESIGIGMAQGNGIEIGTSQFSSNGTVKYRAFYAAFPEDDSPVIITDLAGTVGPGSVVAAEIHENSANNWTVGMLTGITKTLSGHMFSTSVTHSGSQLSADWFIQPIGLPLASFDLVEFYLANATVSGTTYRLNSLPDEEITLYDSSLTCRLSETGNIGALGDSFNMTFLRSGPPCPARAFPVPPISFGLLLTIGGLLLVIPAAAILALVTIRGRRAKIAPTAHIFPRLSGIGMGAASSYCSKCGSRLGVNAKFCDKCGTPRSF
jgi:hypothetical protein